MKKRTVYWIPKINALVILSALCMICSAVVRIVWACGEDAISRPTLWFQIFLPIAANLLFVLMAFTDSQDRLYRLAVPVWMGCVFFAVKALGFPYSTIRDAYKVFVPNTAEATNLILAHPELFRDYEITKGKMDDVFLAVTGKKLREDEPC